jgi:hypothetical protein
VDVLRKDAFSAENGLAGPDFLDYNRDLLASETQFVLTGRLPSMFKGFFLNDFLEVGSA